MMNPVHYTMLSLLLCLFAGTRSAQAQCSANAAVTHVTCAGLSNGSIDLTASNGTAPYTYLWSNNQTDENLFGLVAGTYTCTVTDALACTATVTATVAEPLPLTAIANGGTLNCVSNSLAVTVNINSGTPPYNYLWSNGETTQAPTISIPGQYTVTVTDALGCTTMAQTDVLMDANAPIANAGPDQLLDCLSLSVQCDASGTSSGPEFTILWTGPGINQANQFVISPIVSIPGIYTLLVTNIVNGCTATDQMIVTIDAIPPIADAGPDTGIPCGGGTATLDGSGSGGAQYNFLWAGAGINTSNFDLINPIVNIPGTYFLTITNTANGCTATDQVRVFSGPAIPEQDIAVSNITCLGGDGAITLSFDNGAPPYTYLWSTGATTKDLNNLNAGTYSVTLTDATSCSHYAIITITQAAATITNATQTSPSNCATADGSINLSVNSGTGPYTYLWSNGATTQDLANMLSGLYTVTITNAVGCTVSASYTIQVNGGLCGLLKGRVYQDLVENCQEDGEPGLLGWIMKAQGSNGTFYGVTDANGNYNIGVFPGDYTVFIQPPNPLWDPCWLSLPVGSVAVNDTLGGFDFPVKIERVCPALSVDITSSNLRRCFSSNYYSVQYCNHGTEVATDAYIILNLDPFLTPLGSSLPYTNLGNGTLRFEVGDLDLGECGSFYLYVKLSCDAGLGQTHCTEAHIYPDSSCIPSNALWSGASLRISSECLADSVRFSIENVGSGNMTNPVNYIIIEDQVMLMSAPLQLNAGELVTVSVPANGSTWRLEMDQEAFHPGVSQPSISVEGCTSGATFSTGFVTQFSANDADGFVDIDCKENTGSYDPNDKQAFPKGYGTAHYIRPGTPLEYQIRFQNTGNDTAFTVRVVDTLSAWLDPTTLRPGASSHNYTWDLNGAGVLTYLFENILLPDSNINEPASNGFFKFTIYPRVDAPLETMIENTAEIYFDFNEAIVTNTTFHRLGENFVTVGLWQPEQARYAVLVTPNPFSDAAFLEVKGLHQMAPLRLQVFDLQGKLQVEMISEGAVFQLKKGGLAGGVYLFRIDQKGASVGAGKLIIQD